MVQMTATGANHCALWRHSISWGKHGRDFRRGLVPIITNQIPLFSQRKQISCELIQVPLEVSRTSLLQFDQLQTESELHYKYKMVLRMKFGCFIAREALLEEEYWTAAWLRAESQWEGRSSERYVDNDKRKFAEQEFNALKRRCSKNPSENCTCIVAVREEESNTKQPAVTGIVGTLDLSIHNLFQKETFPLVRGSTCSIPLLVIFFKCVSTFLPFGLGQMHLWARVKAPWFSTISRVEASKYAYVSNLCVSKSERRKGIGRNMLCLAIEGARSHGAEELYVHVNGHNMAAWQLYQRIGFQMVETPPTPFLSAGDNNLLSYKI